MKIPLEFSSLFILSSICVTSKLMEVQHVVERIGQDVAIEALQSYTCRNGDCRDTTTVEPALEDGSKQGAAFWDLPGGYP